LQEGERAARAVRNDEAAATKAATGRASRFFGVYWDKRDRRWHAHVWSGGKHHTIGVYDDDVDAARDHHWTRRDVDKWLLANKRPKVNLADDDTLLEWHKTYASIYVGVVKNGGNWTRRAQIKVDYKVEDLGTYVTQKEAALAFDRRARRLRRGTNLRLDGTCNELGRRGKVVTQVEDEPGS
jgi:hypothetical protein